MKTFQRVHIDDALRQMSEWFLQHTAADGNGLIRCSHCGSIIKGRIASLSIHSIEFEQGGPQGDMCAGGGECLQLYIPYCANCEPVPEESGCIHTHMFTNLARA